MKWLVVSPENQGEEIKSIVKVLEENKADFFVLKMNDASEKVDLDSNEMGKFTHCVFGCNPVVSNGFSMLLLGYFAGKKAPVYMTKCDAAIFNGSDSSVKVLESVEEISSYLRENFNSISNDFDKAETFRELFDMGIPFAADSYEYCIQKEKFDICEKLLKAGLDVNSFTSDGVPLLCVASRNDCKDQMKKLISLGADINIISRDRGYTPVMDCVWRKNYEMTKVLIDNKADLHVMSLDGQSILVLAVGNGDKKIVDLLVSSGADPDVKDSMGMSARGYAKLFKKEDLVEIMARVPEKTE